jgi:hypothetical protein
VFQGEFKKPYAESAVITFFGYLLIQNQIAQRTLAWVQAAII